MTDPYNDPIVERQLRNPVLAPEGIGFVGGDLPIDLFAATRRPFGHLPWRHDEATPWADRWLESSFPYWARSILEQWHEGAFDELGTVVFSRADDATQRLFYYVTELESRGRLRGPKPRIFDIAFVDRESSLQHTATAVAELATVLGVGEDGLAEGVERINALRRKLSTMDRARTDRGPLFERVGRAALWTDPTQWIHEVTIPTGEPDSASVRARVLLAGSVPPDDRLHRVVERGGGSVIGEAHVHGLGRLGGEVAFGSERPERTLARHLIRTSTGPRAMIDRAGRILGHANRSRADAVVLWFTREDEAFAWHVPQLERALRGAGIAVLTLAATRWQADDDTNERIVDFVRKIRAST